MNIKKLEFTDVSLGMVSFIRCGKMWRHISKDYRISRSNKEHLSLEVIHKICKEVLAGHAQKDIAKKYGIPANYISDIKACRRYKHISKLYFK